MRAEPTIERLRAALEFDREIGRLRWRVSIGSKPAGSVAGFDSQGYRNVKIDGWIIGEHVVVWALEHGAWPPHEIDHRNRRRAHNDPDNLRLATRQQQSANSSLPTDNTSGFKGVSYYRQTRRWKAQIRVGGRTIGLGYFATREEAAGAYATAATTHFGEYAHPARKEKP